MSELMNIQGGALAQSALGGEPLPTLGHLRINHWGNVYQSGVGPYVLIELYQDNMAQLCDIRTSKTVGRYCVGENQKVAAGTITPDAKKVVLISRENASANRQWRFSVFDIGTDRMTAQAEIVSSQIIVNLFSIYAFSGDNLFLINSRTRSDVESYYILKVCLKTLAYSERRIVKPPMEELDYLISAAPTRDGRQLMILSSHNQIFVVNTSNLKTTHMKNAQVSGKQFTTLNTAKAKDVAVMCASDSSVYLYDMRAARLRKIHQLHCGRLSIMSAWFNSDGQYILVFWTGMTDKTRMGLEIVRVATGKCVFWGKRMSGGMLGDDFGKRLRKLSFDESVIDAVYNEMYALYYKSTDDYIKWPTRLSYCPKSHRIAFGCGDENGEAGDSGSVFVVDIKTLDIARYPYTGKVHVDDITLRGNTMIVYGTQTDSPYDEYRFADTWDLQRQKIVDRQKTRWMGKPDRWTRILTNRHDCLMLRHMKGVSDEWKEKSKEIHAYSARYALTLSQDKKRIRVHDRRFNVIGAAALPSGCHARCASFGSNDAAFYVLDSIGQIRRFVVDESAGKCRATTFTTRGEMNGFPDDYIQESRDGRYLCYRRNRTEKGRIVYAVYDTQQKAFVHTEENPLNDTRYWSAFDRDFSLRINILPYAGVIRFHDPVSYEELVTLKVYVKDRFLWHTTPDDVAKSGWFYTNNAQRLTVYSETPDGEAKMLADGSELKQRYFDQFSRPDLIKAKLENRAGYAGTVAGLAGISKAKQQLWKTPCLALPESKED